MNISPLADRVVIEPIQEDELSAAGIVIPDTAEKDKPQKGKVLAVGPGKVGDDGKRVTPEVKKGDTVLFTQYGPSEFKVDGKEVLIASESDILAVLKK
ncbi:MAG: co-chaperone GroES [bacterium]|nr:co-chaperone GroES [bacterium]MDZ4247905.1 co-chaperone GroES [Patescibacteria group bacterium]